MLEILVLDGFDVMLVFGGELVLLGAVLVDEFLEGVVEVGLALL